MPSEVCLPNAAENASMTLPTCSRLTPLMVAMAVPSFCTALALMCLSTSAASCSPSDSSSTAARCTPVKLITASLLVIGGHPVLHHLRHLLGIALHRFACIAQPVFVGVGGQRALFGFHIDFV